MSKMVLMALSMIALNISLMLFTCSAWDEEGVCMDSSVVPTNSIWLFVLNPFNVDTSNFWESLFGTADGLAALAGAVLIIGSFFSQSETPLYIGIALSLLPSIYGFVKLSQNMKSSLFFGELTGIFTIVLVGSIIIAWIFILVDWARGR